MMKNLKTKASKRLTQVSKNMSQHPETDFTKTDKEKLILKILKYQSNKRFGERIKKNLGIKYTRAQLIKNNQESLESILFRIRNYLNSQNLDAVFEHMAQFSAKGYEDLVCGIGYDISGFSSILLQNPSFWDNLERYKIERHIPDIPPAMQLVYIITSTTYIAHLQNNIQAPSKTEQSSKSPSKPSKSKTKSTNKKVDTNKDKNTSTDTKMNVGDVI